MNFRTNIQLKSQENQIDYKSKLLFIGSCFSQHISKKLDYFKFDVLTNPFGILYNPKAIETLIANSINGKNYTENDVFYLNERWHCFDSHSDLSSPDKTILLDNLNKALTDTKVQIKTSSHISITLGTSWVYRNLKSKNYVANCHKIPQKEFAKELLSISVIEKSLDNICLIISEINEKAKIIFTVSPVRHLKDGFVENAQSKAHLLAGIHRFIKKTNDSFYFPSYEIMLDDLRDYRFYSEDMIHPNQVAIDYIWKLFKTVWIDKKCHPILKKVNSIQKALAHKPFNANSGQHKLFLEKLDSEIESLQHEFGIVI